MTPADKLVFDRKRRARNLVLGLILGSFALLFFGITIVRMFK